MKKCAIILMVFGLITILSYTLVYAATTQPTKAATPAKAATQPAKEPTIADKRAMVKAAKISMVDAIAIATKKVPGTIIDGELEKVSGKNIYSFELVPRAGNIINEVSVDAADGTVISVGDANAADPTENPSAKQETAASEAQDKAEKQALAKAAKISMTDAIGIAAQKAAGTVIVGELLNDKGKTVYTMEVLPDAKTKTTKRVILDATSGTVLSIVNLTAAMIAAETAAEMNAAK